MKKIFLYTVFTVFISSTVAETSDISKYNISNNQLNEIETRVNKMSVNELILRKYDLEQQAIRLEETKENSQNPSVVKDATTQLSLVSVELIYVVAALVGAGVILSDSGDIDDAPVVRDLTPPVITINGDNPAIVELGGSYTDAGATASDDSGNATLVTSGTVDTNSLGSYQITYTATDSSGNISQAFRTVNVVDTTAPVVTVTGDNPVTVELGSSYTDAGATASDISGDVTVVTTGAVDTNTIGSYTLTYTSTDSSGNAGTAARTVNVVDTTAPVFTSSAIFSAQENQTAIGSVTASDLTVVTFSISGNELAITSSGVLSFVTAPDYEIKTVYTATVTASDTSSNSTTQEITVNVTNDPDDDDTGTGTGTGTGTSTGTGTGTGTGT